MDRVQLGAIYLPSHDSDHAESSSAAATTWSPVTSDKIRSGFLSSLSPAEETIVLLRDLLGDPGINFEAEYQRCDGKLAVRCSLIPSDGRGGNWRKRSRVDRAKLLKRLFLELKSGWEGGGDWLLASLDEDRYRVNDLYALVPSPSFPSRDDWSPASLGDEDTKARLAAGGDLKGLKSTLYKYQIRSVNRMLRMEMEPGLLVDPRFTEFEQAGRPGHHYYVNLSTFDIQSYPGQYDLPRGGILCEQMGVGKTLICLSLILATLHQPAQPPPHDIDLSPILTENMLHSYPFDTIQEVRDQVSKSIKVNLAVPSLAEMCANILACRDHSADLAFSAMQVDSRITSLIRQRSFYYKYPPDTSCMRHAKAVNMRTTAERVFLSNTTLVAVPPILVDQWMQEIEKHVETGAIKVLKVDGELPCATTLLEYDVILMDVNRLGREDTLARLRMNLPPSNLLDVRWKRLILDEGHVAGEKMSTAMIFAQSLNVERRWAVTGTPTKHLQQGGEDQIASLGLRSAIDVAQLPSNDPLSSAATRWGRRDLDDVSRFGVIISHFLGTQPFRSDLSFSEAVTAHLRRRNIPFGAVRRLRSLMDALMVKHRTHEIDTEASLPPATIETVVLPFEPMQRLTYNVLASLVVANVYACNFEDEDYFLHPRNVKSFRQVVQNLHLACTWFSGCQVGAAACLDRLRDDLQHSDRLSDEARVRMSEAAEHLERALNTPGWSEWVRLGMSLPIDAPNLPAKVRAAWSVSRGLDSDWVDAHSLMTLRDQNKNGTTVDELVETGQKVIDGIVQRALSEDLTADDIRAKKEEKSAKSGHALAQSTAAHKPKTISSPRRRGKGVARVKKDDKDETEQAIALAVRNAQVAAEEQARSHLPQPLDGQMMVKTRSHKMNHVVKALKESLPDDRFVIFGDPAELGLCGELLDLFDISWVFAGGMSTAKARIEAIDSFQKSDTKACLLDIKVAARGLNLVVANRMILLAPMWSLDTQAQAIKRIHRIGQTRATKIEILVTEGTFEEDIAKRASTSRTEQEEKLYTRELIEHPRFVYAERESDFKVPVRMSPIPADATKMIQESPGSASTPDTNLVTPLSTASSSSAILPRLVVREDSPTLGIGFKSAMKGRKLEMGMDVNAEDEQPPRKKTRVAFE